MPGTLSANHGWPAPVGQSPVNVPGDLVALRDPVDAQTPFYGPSEPTVKAPGIIWHNGEFAQMWSGTKWMEIGSFVGEVRSAAFSAAPTPNWHLCDHAALSRTSYPVLFARIGTTYGAGDGTLTFNLPDQSNRYPKGNTPGATGGTSSHTHSSAAHTHPLSNNGHAKITIAASTPVIYGVRVNASSYTSTHGYTGSAGASMSQSAGTGMALGGATDSTTPGATGSASSEPPYTGYSFWIRIQ